ncbi:hypothetical protein [Azospirillum doebereinerae]|uniref:Uncharacterized protein n=1 Tax=Azospirillum doebereinerae TaxID=92933 RepID=A0A3S0WRL5_9PROT|nr:hypothetical protein [Azospirillum doebereinerae]RUQ65156.1 hypothetical protein EJ913_25765 [Azospirillum doebereinerae]
MATTGTVTLSPELRLFAQMLGAKLDRLVPGSWVSEEYTDIAELRLSQTLGKPLKDPEFIRIWSAVFDEACTHMQDDDPADPLPNDTVPTEAEMAGLPFRQWHVSVNDLHGRAIPGVLVNARTMGEAYRLAQAMNIPGAIGYGFTPAENIPRCIVRDLRKTWDDKVVREIAAKLGVDCDSPPTPDGSKTH